MPRDCNRLLCGCFPQALEFTAYFWGWKLRVGGGNNKRLIYITKLKHVSLENISSGVRTWEMLIWDICSKTPLAAKPWEGCGASGVHKVLGWAAFNVGARERCPERRVCAWQKVRETLKERCKSHKVRQTHPQERYLCITLLSADGLPNNTRGAGGRNPI